MADRDELKRQAEEAALLNSAMPGGLVEAAGAFHEMYSSYRSVGFSRRQSLWLIGCCLTGNPGNPPDDD